MSAKLNLHADATVPLVAIDGIPLINMNISLDIDADDEDAVMLAYAFTSMARQSAPKVEPPIVAKEEPKTLVEVPGDRFNYIEVT